VNSKKHRVERNDGGFQRRLELENRRSALTPSLPYHPPTLRAPVHAYAPDLGAHLHVCARARSRLRARFTRAPVVASDLPSRPLSCISRPLSCLGSRPNTLNPPIPLNPLTGKNTYFLLKHGHLEAGLFLALPRCAPAPIASPQTPHSLLHLTPNAQRQNRRLPPHVHLKTPRGQTAHVLNN
jgi:hypothetical protein